MCVCVGGIRKFRVLYVTISTLDFSQNKLGGNYKVLKGQKI